MKVDGSIQEVELAKNVPYSVARKHQQLLCGYLQGSFFLPMMIWKVDLVKQYTKLHVHVYFLHDERSILLFL